ncbi:hypothetical protein [Parahaliea mediterranea]|uniref:hypothetical protein n=1 Tax=Parahaliea mediterranea TaxID=651086 RepID=UPI000E2F487F|nr:hypothetical protein [Parahaliea mediterranea]
MYYHPNLSLAEHHRPTRIIIRQAHTSTRHVPQGSAFLAWVREWLKDRHLAYTTADTIAAYHRTSPKTIYCRMRDAGVSYHQLIDDERRRRLQALPPHASCAEAAEALDFRSRRALHSAMRRWYGMTFSEHQARRGSQWLGDSNKAVDREVYG